MRRAGLTLGATLLALLAVGGLLRLGCQTGPGRALLMQSVNGLKVGPFGRLAVSGLRGDPWHAFSVDRLTLSDSHGVWIAAQHLKLSWRASDLLQRRLHVQALGVERIDVLRRPVLTPSGADQPLPVDIVIDTIAARLDLAPAFAERRGLYDVHAHGAFNRAGGQNAALRANSLLHRGDFLTLNLAGQSGHEFTLAAHAVEARGGALAGSLGLAADRPFVLAVTANVARDAGEAALSAKLGGAEPFSAKGTWRGGAFAAQGHLNIAASRLLQLQARMLGPQLDFALEGRPRNKTLAEGHLTVHSENLTLAAAGLFDTVRQSIGPGGVKIDANIIDFTRIFGVAKMGAAHVTAGFGGGPNHWLLAGQFAVKSVVDPQYALNGVSGPLSLEGKAGETILRIKALGDGGAGKGLLAALLGAKPNGAAQVSWLSDGRMLVRGLEVQGPGLKVSGIGEHDLFGILSFKGAAVVGNLALAHAGAKGRVLVSWTAEQRKEDSPWQVVIDAKGEHLATGYAELDRLLGESARLTSTMAYAEDVFHVTQSVLTGAAGAVTASGLIGPDAAVRLDVTWRAEGPMAIGPLEIDGKATGRGQVGGTLDRPKANVTADIAAITLPATTLRNAHLTLSLTPIGADLGGALAVAGVTDQGPARAATQFRVVQAGLDLSGIDVTGAGLVLSGSAGFRANDLSAADLNFSLSPGAFLSHGGAQGRFRMTNSGAGPQVALDVRATEASPVSDTFTIRSLTLSAKGPSDKLPFTVKSQGVAGFTPWRIAGAGVFHQAEGGDRIEFSGSGRLREADIHTLTPAMVTLSEHGADGQLRLAIGPGRADIDFTQSLGGSRVNAKADNLALSLISPELVGRFDANLALSGQGMALQGDMTARVIGAGSRDAGGLASVGGDVKASLRNGGLTLDAALIDGHGLKATTNLWLPVDASASPFSFALNRQRALHGTYAVDGELAPLWDLFWGGDASLSGRLVANGSLAGSLADPRAVGTAALTKGRFRDAQSGLKLESLALQADLRDTAVDVASISATDGARGLLTGAGRVSFLRDGASTFRLEIKDFRLIDNDLAQAQATGSLTLNRGANGRVKLAGALTVDHAQISPNPPVPSGVAPMEVIERNAPVRDDETSALQPANATPVALDVDLSAPGGIFIKGRGLNLELSLKAHVTGATDQPQLTGLARVVRGDYNFAGQRFQIDDRGQISLGSTAEAIRLDLTAMHESPTLTAMIRIQGTAARPEITLSSNPVLPKDEVLSQVLFGASAAQLAPLQAAQLASALSGLAGGGGFDVVGGLRNFAHLDRLAIGGSVATGTTFSGGKYLRDNVYLEVIGGGREGPGAQVEWRVRRRLAVVSKVTRQGESQLSVKWRKDY